MVDAYTATAAGLVLLGLGCIAQDLYTIIDSGNSSFTPEESVLECGPPENTWSIAAVILAVDDCYSSANALTGNLSAGSGKAPTKGFSPTLYVIALCESVELLTGFGMPYRGDDLKHGSQSVIELSEQLQDALPHSSWQADAAQGYANRVAADVDTLVTTADLDAELADLAQRCADFVIHARTLLFLLKGLLLVAYLIERTIYNEEDPWGAWSWGVKASAAGVLALTAIGVVLGLWIALGLNNKAIEIKTSYQLLGDLTPGQLAAVPETVIASTPDARVSFAPAGGPATPFSDARTIPDISARAAAQTPNVAMLVGTSALSTFARPAPAPLAASSTPAATTSGRTRSVNLADQAAEPATPPQAIAQPESEDGGRAPIQATESGLAQGAETQPALASSSIR